MKKSLVILLLIISIGMVFCPPSTVNASGELTIDSKSAVLINEDGQVLYEQNSHERRPIASMVKIMTLLQVYEAIDNGKVNLDDSVVVSANASSMGGSQAFIQTNNTYKLSELLKTIIVCSANDSCVALAEHISGSVSAFVKEMNERVTSLGLKDTVYVNCTGLPAVSQYSSAYDSAIIFSNLVKHNNYFDYTKIWTEEFAHPDGRTTLITNTNKLIRQYPGCDGGKTGFTNEAMHCLTATAKKGDTRVIACVVGAPSSAIRFEEVTAMLNYAFANYESKIMLSVNEKLDDVKVYKAVNDSASIAISKDLKVFTNKNKIKGEVVLKIDDKIVAPLVKGDKVGQAMIVDNGQVLASCDIVLTCDLPLATYWDNIMKIMKNW